ncbi:MAG: cephalosporin hydroxylase [Nitrospina sp.]|nr:cephalosporin hydroxylase [Nitrospina sp.]
MTTPGETFLAECRERVASYPESPLSQVAAEFMTASALAQYSYNFSWMGRPIIQYPQDMVAMAELIWRIKPDLVIEAGIAHGGSLILSASMLAMLDYCDAVESNTTLDPSAPKRQVLGIDIDIRAHNRAAIEAHPMSHRIQMLEGSSISEEIVTQVHDIASRFTTVLVCLDSNHTHEHVLGELEAYAPLTSLGSYCVVFDTLVEDMPEDFLPNRPWSKGDNPKTAVWAYLELLNKEGRTAKDGRPLALEVDEAIENKLLLTVAPNGFLYRPES